MQFSFVVIYALVLLGLVNGSRSSFRLLNYWRERGSGHGDLVLLYGSGHSGTLALREALSNRDLGIRPVGFLDDDPEKAGRYVNGYPVLGSLQTLPAVVRNCGIKGLVVATDKIPSENVRAAKAVCDREGVWVMRFSVGFHAISQ